MHVITTSEDVCTFAAALAEKPFIAVDTEFMREKTYWPILCLIQAAAEGIEAVIDPLAEGIDLAPFLTLLTERRIVKIFHAARQDIEIFYRLTGAVPAPLFDSQVAAMACGFGDQIGYEPLIRNLLKTEIDKGPRFTDWSRRPLTKAQLAYALSDVTHLRDAYPILKERLARQEREHWVHEEMRALDDPGLYFTKPEDAWRRLKLRNLRIKEIGPAIKLAEWREHEAQMRNMPRSRILRDEAILELSRMRPTTLDALATARSIPKGYENSGAATRMIAAIAAGVALPKHALPTLSANDTPKAPGDIVDLLKVLLKRQCAAFDVAPKLVASTADLEVLALDDNADIPALNGWRRQVFGETALKLKHGEIALTLKSGKLAIEPT